MANLNGFDASQVPEQQEFTALPAGDYVAIATTSEFKPTKTGNGEYLQFTFEVLAPEAFKGRKTWARMNLRNPNATAVDIAQRELAALCRAVGVIKPKDSSELHNKPVVLTIDTELDERKRESNVIKKYTAVGGAAPAAGAAAPAASAPAPTTWNAPAAGGANPAAPWKTT